MNIPPTNIEKIALLEEKIAQLEHSLACQLDFILEKERALMEARTALAKKERAFDREQELTVLTSQHKELQSRYGKVQRYNAWLEDMVRNAAPHIPNEMLDINTYKYC